MWKLNWRRLKLNKKEFVFYYGFFILLSIFYYDQILKFNPSFSPKSFYYPNGIFSLIPYEFYLKLFFASKVLILSLLVFSFLKIRKFAESKWVIGLFLLFYGLAISYRFSFFHTPHLEMFPILALLGLLLGGNWWEKAKWASALMILVYFVSGLSKLKNSGIAWLDSENIYQLVRCSDIARISVANRLFDFEKLSEYLRDSKIYFVLGSIGLLYELALPLLLRGGRTAKILFFSTLLFHFINATFLSIFTVSAFFPIFCFYFLAFEKIEEKN